MTENTDFLSSIPQDLHAEAGLLGSYTLEGQAFPRGQAIIQNIENPLVGAGNQAFLDLMVRQRANGKSCSLEVMVGLAEDAGIWADGARDRIKEFMASTGSWVHVEEYAHRVREMALKRQIMQVHGVQLSRCKDPSAEFSRLLEEAQREFSRLSASVGVKGTVDIRSVIDSFSLEEDDTLAGLSTPLDWLNLKIGGLKMAMLIVIAARTSVGKTALLIQLMLHLVTVENVPVGFFSLEMSAAEIAGRIRKMPHGMADSIPPDRLLIEECGRLSTSQLIDRAERLHRLYGIKALFVDYLQLIEDRRGNRENRQAEVAAVSRALKGIARHLSIPVIAAAQLNRGVEKGVGNVAREPQLADLRESGAIEQDADVVLMLHRYEGARSQGAKSKTPHPPVIEVGTDIIRAFLRKNRNGPLGQKELRFHKAQTTFHEVRGGGDVGEDRSTRAAIDHVENQDDAPKTPF